MAKISINIKEGRIEQKDIVVGIDLGTTNSLIAITDLGIPKALTIENKTTVPSIVYFNKNSEVVVGESARAKLVTNPENTIYSVKRLLGRSFKDLTEYSSFYHYRIIDEDTGNLVKIELNGRYYSPIELSAYILKELKAKAEETLGMSVSKAVITVPAYFNDSQRQATRDAGKLAGINVLRIVNEPTAASLAYGIGLSKEDKKTVAIYDLGGGTFDISILKIQDGIFEVLATNGDTYLGGDDFDRAIVSFWLSTHNISFESIKHNKSLLQQLRLTAELAKKELSGKDIFQTELEINDIPYQLNITQQQFEKIIEPIVNKTIECCKRAVQDAKIEGVDEVIMVGGSTRVLAVKEAVKAFFDKDKLNDTLNPDEVVALGAAIEADILSGNRKDILLLDVTPLSLGIETIGGLMDVIITRNTKIPIAVARQYTTSIDGQTNLKIAVYQGERELVSENRKLAEFVLPSIPAMPAGLPKIQISFMINADGILKIDAEELRSGVKQTVEVKPQYGLTDEQVEQMLLDSLTHAGEDMQKRMLLEAKNEAEQLKYLSERFIEKNKGLLSMAEIIHTQALLQELQTAIQSSDKDYINSCTDKLNEYTRPFAERVMDSAIAAALKGKKIEE